MKIPQTHTPPHIRVARDFIRMALRCKHRDNAAAVLRNAQVFVPRATLEVMLREAAESQLWATNARN